MPIDLYKSSKKIVIENIKKMWLQFKWYFLFNQLGSHVTQFVKLVSARIISYRWVLKIDTTDWIILVCHFLTGVTSHSDEIDLGKHESPVKCSTKLKRKWLSRLQSHVELGQEKNQTIFCSCFLLFVACFVCENKFIEL